MNNFKKLIRKKALWILIVFSLFVYLNNTPLLVKGNYGRPFLFAHRGLGQTFPMDGITGDTNTAERIFEPEHPYLENTIPSIKAAFDAGADMVEIDVQQTKDGQLCVFHDNTLEYRTNGKGSTKDFTMEELKKLDVGYRYTADQGKTYPFRGKGIGLMPSLGEVLQEFPNKSFAIHIKSNEAVDGELLVNYLKNLSKEQLDKIVVYGGDKPIRKLKELVPNLHVMSKELTKKALIQYMAIGWTGYVPPSMKESFIYLPQKYSKYLWGWPNRFVQRMKDSDTYFVLVAGDGEWSEGFDKIEDLEAIPDNYKGGIWTNRIDRIAPFFKK